MRKAAAALIGLAPICSAAAQSAPSVAPAVASAVEDAFPPSRRKEQRQTTPGHILTPAAANIPGMGFTYGILGSAFNVQDTEMDISGFRFWGDLSGIGFGVLDLPLGTPELTLNVFAGNFTKAAVESHRRGIKSEKKDAKLVEIDAMGIYLAQVNWRLFERRLSLLASVNRQSSSLGAVRDRDGNKLADGSSETHSVTNNAVGAIVDLTDDRSDPRQGLQVEVYRYDKPASDAGEVDFYQMEYNATGFVPVGSYSTWAFNLYRADAIVQTAGESDEAKVREDVGFNCDQLVEGEARVSCEGVEKEFVEERLAANRHGTAPPLGGTQRLRSYVTNRFSAAHTLFFGSELRWNLTEEFTPFNIFVASGVRTGVQVAFFAEGGTVAEIPDDLTKNYRYSIGTGVRFILASGFVVRLDLANGDEGTQPSLIFQYPWSVF